MARGTGGFEAPDEGGLDRRGNIDPPPGHISMETEDGSLVFIGRIAPEGARVVSGYARHSRIQRRQRRDLLDWEGTDILAVEVPLVIGSYAAGLSIEKDIDVLERLAGFSSTDDPPRVRIDGPVPHARGHWWQVEEPDWGEALWRKDDHRVQQAVTVTLVEPIDTSLHRLKRSNPFKSATMKKGENLRDFAKRVLGDGSRWKDIQALNPSRAPSSMSYRLKKERRLTLPPLEDKKKRR